jgi:tetratricopeptide (TPR) repeat protein
MAELYRGIRRIPHRRVAALRPSAFALCALACLLSWPRAAVADGPSAAERPWSGEADLARQAERLAHGDAEQRQQAYRFLQGLDFDALPALLELRGHPALAVRCWAKQGIRSLGMEDPRVATALSDSHLVARVIQAYANPLDYKALPVITPFLNDERMEVREAARRAVGGFGKEAIWQLREAYLEATGKHAERSWAADRVARELYAVLDRPRIAEADRLLTRGLSAFVSGDLETMKQCFDQALTIHPGFEKRAEMAPGYAAFGEKLLEKDDLDPAAAAYSRALRLDPRAAEARTWRARLAFIRSEQRLHGGVVDIDGYQEALRLEPGNQAAATVLDRLGGAWLERQRTKKRWARIGAVVLLGLFSLLLLARSRSKNSKSKNRFAA